MYPVNSTFHTLSTKDAPKTRVRVYFIGAGVDCTDDNAVQTNGTLLVGAVGDTDSNGRIGQNGITFTEMFNPDKNIQIGTAVSYQIGMTLLNTDGALNGFSYGRCKVYLDVYDAANSAWRVCPMGVFVIDIPTKRRVQLVSATGYDQMQLLDTICDSWWSGLNWSGGITLSALLTSMANQLGVKVSPATASAILNSSVSYTEAPFACVEVTYREVLEYIAEATGTIARFDRDGALDMRWFEYAEQSSTTETLTGDPVSFVNGGTSSIDSLTVPFSPIQNLNGYDHPWPAGGGKNIIPTDLATLKARNTGGTWTDNKYVHDGLTFTINPDGTITINGTATADTYLSYIDASIAIPLTAGSYILHGIGSSDINVFAGKNGAWWGEAKTSNKTLTSSSDFTFSVASYIPSGKSFTGFVLKPMFEKGSAASAWEPNSNFCPISGRTGLNVYVSPTQDPDDATVYNVDWSTKAGTVYGGTVDVVTGVLTVDMVNIPSYNGETINEPWLSSMDAYAAGTAPTIGAQVVYTLSTPVTYQLTPQEVDLLVGQNYVWADTGEDVTAAITTRNIVTVDADALGSGVMSLDIAEYQAAAIDLLKVKIAEDDIGVTVGSGTNQYTIVNNLFLYGSTATIITNRATPIYNRLNGLGAYTPIQAKLIYDWSLEAGDIINIVRDSTTYPVLIFQQTLAWRGGYVTADILADGDNVRPVMDYNERASYRMASEMSQKVGDNEIISKINQTAESIQIQASRVDLAGYVTFTNLSTSGQTTINGGNITTGTIDASVVSVTNLNASNITSGTMSASKISGGTLTLGGANNTDGTMTVKDANGVTAATVDNTGITVNGTQAIGGTDMPTTLVLSDGSIVSQTNGENSFKVGRNSLGGGFLSIYKQVSGVIGTINNAGITFFDGTKAKIRYDYNGFIIRYDNGYGVTDSPAVQLFHQSSTGSSITFATPPGDSGYPTTIGSAGSTFGADTTFRANATVNGVLDVTPRRCYGALSQRGWYRVFNITGGLGRAGSAFTITLHIGRAYVNANNELHTVTLLANYYNQEFSSEVSKSNYLGITKVRYTADGSNNGHIDIYYDLTVEGFAYVDFDVHCRPENAYLIRYNSVTPTAVADSPSGETVLTEYTFAANATPLRYVLSTVSITVTDYGTTKFTYNANYLDLGNIGIVYLSPPENVLQGLSFSTLLQIENLPVSAISANGYVRSLGTGQDGMDTWQLSGKKIYLRKRGGGNLIGTFGGNPLLQVCIIGIK